MGQQLEGKTHMVDCYALMDLPRRAWLDREEARTAFQRAGAARHPDAASSETERAEREISFQQLQEAYAVLASTPTRLKHLAALLDAGFESRSGVLDETLMKLFSSINEGLHQADALASKKEFATSNLARALLASECLETQEILETLGGKIVARQELLQERLMAWDANPQHQIADLQNAAQEAAFLDRWEQQIQQRRMKLID
jgi:hypothetical protein